MAEQVKDLIEKIYGEGVQAAEAKAAEIEKQANLKAEDILKKAKKQSEESLAAAEERISRMEDKVKALLAQAARDLLLSLKQEINSSLERLVTADLRSALTPDALHKIILEAVKAYGGVHKHDVTLTLKKEDAEQLQKHFLSRLKEETKKNIIINASEGITGGFTISFDSGKSQFDFSDKAMAEYIGSYVKPGLKEILKEAVSK